MLDSLGMDSAELTPGRARRLPLDVKGRPMSNAGP